MKILLIQTAFIGDVILATSLIESVYATYPTAKIDFLLRKGNENLLQEHLLLNEVLIWDKKNKYKSLFKLLKKIRSAQYDAVLNLQRFGATGLLTAFSKAKIKAGFKKNPFSWAFTHKYEHIITTDPNSPHEIERNSKVLESIGINELRKPKLYPSAADKEKVKEFIHNDFICIAPTSVWFTKQYPLQKWIDCIKKLLLEEENYKNLSPNFEIHLLGAPSDRENCQKIVDELECKIIQKNLGFKVNNLAGKLSLMQSAALMQHTKLVLANDSAPLHLASSVNAPVCAVFCSTVPAFGFTPLSDTSFIIETEKKLDCRPCGLHGYKSCPKGHFECAESIKTEQILRVVEKILD
ncbi:glycosyltransferase family 9 protein [Bernardetia sp.]|uniref:glycosyltransferase family 9 protein n=1 Tax=Bernardetia sp. TaxID=1937974 RepID=UPI0025C17B05|nr:glycosyltransferase family 9 protein [Bernardetia sp.]